VKTVPVEKAVGMVLGHDITRIVPGKFKGRAFRRGTVIQTEDIPALLDLGKRHIFVLDLDCSHIHEDDAAIRIANAAAGKGIRLTTPSEGRVNLIADHDGLLTIDVEALSLINHVEDMAFATLHTGQQVHAEQAIAGTRIIPLATKRDRVESVEQICAHHFPVISVRPLQPFRVGVVTTGSEIYHGRIKDKFGPVLTAKFEALGSRVVRQVFVSDDLNQTVKAIDELIADGADFIALTGGMSVDPDDQTPSAIRATGATIVMYGAPIFPGAMFMLAYLNDIPVVGLPGCVMYHQTSIFDLVIPRILAGDRIKKEDIISFGHGGFCAGCAACRYPVCSFGK